MRATVTAFIPSYNNADTLQQAIDSVKLQTSAFDELLVLDDSSLDGSAEIAAVSGARVIRHAANLGRGAMRARGVLEASGDLILSCDSTSVLRDDFLEKGLPWFADDRVAAVCGAIRGSVGTSAAERWRDRHLFKFKEIEDNPQPRRRHSLATWGAILRKSAVLSVGNFNTDLRYGEDFELGTRLLAAGYDIIYDPSLQLRSVSRNNLSQVLERYWRWNAAGNEGALNLCWYLRNLKYTVTVMMKKDLTDGDLRGAVISLLAPHYQFWKSRSRTEK